MVSDFWFPNCQNVEIQQPLGKVKSWAIQSKSLPRQDGTISGFEKHLHFQPSHYPPKSVQ